MSNHNPLIYETLPAPKGDESLTHDDLHHLPFEQVRRYDHDGGFDLVFPMINPAGEIDNLICYPSTEQRPHMARDYQNHACLMPANQKSFDGEVVLAVIGIDNAYKLSSQMLGGKSVKVLTLPSFAGGCFAQMVKAHRPQYALTTHDQSDLIDRLASIVGVEVISTIADVSTALESQSLDELLSDETNTQRHTQAWGEVKPLSVGVERCNPYPVQAFGNLQSVVEKIAWYSQTPHSMAGQSVLGALSTIGQIFVNAPMGYEHKPASLFLLTQAPSGAGKTQVNRLAYKAIYEHSQRIYEQFIQDVQEWQNAKENLKGREKADYLNFHHEPVNNAPIIKDATTEIILDRFISGTVKNQSWATSEAGQFFGGYSLKADTVGNSLSSFTTLWSEGEASRMRKTNAKNGNYKTSAYDCRLTLDLSGQQIIIASAMNDPLLNEQGILARCLLSCEPSFIGSRDWCSAQRMNANPYNDEALQEFWGRCLQLLEKDVNQDRVNMPFADGAREYLARYQQSAENRQRKGEPLAHLSAFASRMAENATRIATLLAFYDDRQSLEVEYLERAFMLVEYSINERLNYDSTPSDTPSDTEKLLAWLIKYCRQQQTNHLAYSYAQSNVGNKALRHKEAFALAVQTLQDTNHVKVIEQDNKRMIYINPKFLS